MTSTELVVPTSGDLSLMSDRKLDNAIKRGHSVAGAHLHSYEHVATVTGVLLRERKRRLPHGQWGKWVADNFNGDRTTAFRYIQMADERAPDVAPVQQIDAQEIRTPEGDIVVPDADVEIVADAEIVEIEDAVLGPDTDIVCAACHGTGRVPAHQEDS